LPPDVGTIDAAVCEQINEWGNAEVYGPGVTPPDDALLIRLSDFKSAQRRPQEDTQGLLKRVPHGWPPSGWKSNWMPVDHSRLAISAWITDAEAYLELLTSGKVKDRFFLN
jgi:hypothetical protein